MDRENSIRAMPVICAAMLLTACCLTGTSSGFFGDPPLFCGLLLDVFNIVVICIILAGRWMEMKKGRMLMPEVVFDDLGGPDGTRFSLSWDWFCWLCGLLFLWCSLALDRNRVLAAFGSFASVFPFAGIVIDRISRYYHPDNKICSRYFSRVFFGANVILCSSAMLIKSQSFLKLDGVELFVCLLTVFYAEFLGFGLLLDAIDDLSKEIKKV